MRNVYAKIKSDYGNHTSLVIARNEDGDVCIKIFGDEDMRIAVSGSRLKGGNLIKVVDAFQNLIDVLNEINGELEPEQSQL